MQKFQLAEKNRKKRSKLFAHVEFLNLLWSKRERDNGGKRRDTERERKRGIKDEI